MTIENTQGKRFYGMHFYPGVAEYVEADGMPYRVFLNEQTIRSMDSTFEGKPVFVHHVNDVEPSIDELRKEADGWVVKSFYNAADGKHWVEFMVVSERGLRAIQKGMRLSNAYIPLSSNSGGLWNGVDYAKEITKAEYDHLAIVPNPRYDESVILTPEQFKKYNEDKQIELKKLANSLEQKGERTMGLNFFKRSKVENTLDLESTMVELPKSKKEMRISELVTEMDKIINAQGYCNMEHLVKVGNDEMSVGELVKKHMDAMSDMEKIKKDAKSEDGGEPGEDDKSMKDSQESVAEDMEAVGDRGGDAHLDNDDKEDMEKEEVVMKKKNDIKKKVASLKNAGPRFQPEEASAVLLTSDKVALGKSRYGSSN